MPKQSYDRKSLKMIDVIKKVAFRNIQNFSQSKL